MVTRLNPRELTDITFDLAEKSSSHMRRSSDFNQESAIVATSTINSKLA